MKKGEPRGSPGRLWFRWLSEAVLTLLLFHLIICAAIGSTRGCKQRSLLYYRTFGHYRAASAQPGSVQVIIPTTHLIRGQMMENGGN
nr:MAG TPA: hypothetical protein [Caudoviricetes sp.]